MSEPPLEENQKRFILNLVKYFQREVHNNGPLLPLKCVQERVANGLGVSIRTVQKMVQEPLGARPKVRYTPRKKLKTEDMPDEMKMKVRNVVDNMYAAGKHVTLRTLNAELAAREIVHMSTSTLNILMRDIGFSSKRHDHQKTVVLRLNEFLKKYKSNATSPFKRQVVFLDETWIFARGSLNQVWQGGSPKSAQRPKGKRFIILHAGHQGGFVENASLISSIEMNAEVFQDWVETQLAPNLEEPSLILLDNASCHSVGVDEYLREHGHEVLRLPPYHNQFNASELILAQAKRYYDVHIGEDGYGDEKVLEMWERALEQCTPEQWRSVVEHTDKLIHAIPN